MGHWDKKEKRWISADESANRGHGAYKEMIRSMSHERAIRSVQRELEEWVKQMREADVSDPDGLLEDLLDGDLAQAIGDEIFAIKAHPEHGDQE